MNLRNILFRYHLRRQSRPEVVMRTWESVRTVAVLYDCGDETAIRQLLAAKDKHIDFFGTPQPEDISWLTQQPSAQMMQDIRGYHYDLLIDLTQQPSLTMHYMAMAIRSDFKVGRQICDGIHDMTINTPAQSTPYYLLEQILRYIQMFTTKTA